MAVTGAIADHARAELPVTWDALSKDSRFGDGLIQSKIDTIKEKVLGSVIATAAETSLARIVQDYLGKLVAIELCAAGIDFWMNQPISESATGTNENHTFTERVAALQENRKNLLAETREMWPLVAPLISYTPLSRAPRPLIDTMDDDFLTPSPQEFPRPFRRTARS